MLRTMGALGMVLGMLVCALWIVRRYDLKLPGRVSATGRKRVELVERLPVDGKRSIALIRRDGCEHLILMGPEGHATIETGIAAPARPEPQGAAAEPPATIERDLEVLKSGFARLVELPRAVAAGVARAQAQFNAASGASAASAVSDADAPVDALPAEIDPAPSASPDGMVVVELTPAEAAAECAPEPVVAAASVVPADPAEAPALVRARSPRVKVAAEARTRTRRPRDTARWNRAAVREALNA